MSFGIKTMTSITTTTTTAASYDANGKHPSQARGNRFFLVLGLVGAVASIVNVMFIGNSLKHYRTLALCSGSSGGSAAVGSVEVEHSKDLYREDNGTNYVISDSSRSNKNENNDAEEDAISDSSRSNNNDSDDDEEDVGDTAIIITSSWIKTHPTLYFIDQVMDSIPKHLIGLHPNAPIYIGVDGPRFSKRHLATDDDMKEHMERQDQLDRYVEMLYAKYDSSSSASKHGRKNNNIRIVVSTTHRHISGNVQKIMRLIESQYNNNNTTKIKYLYYVQHDFSFREDVNHTALVQTFQEEEKIHGKNSVIKIVRFFYRSGGNDRNGAKYCRDYHNNIPNNTITVDYRKNNIWLKLNKHFSDNNHFTTLDYYKNFIQGIPNPTAPEGAINYVYNSNKGSSNVSNVDCLLLGIWSYQNSTTGGDAWAIKHLDGRFSEQTQLPSR